MTISDELNNLFKSSKKDDEQKSPKYVMIRFGVTATDCTFVVVNPDVSTTKVVLDSLEKIPNLNLDDDVYKSIGILYEVVEKQKTISKT